MLLSYARIVKRTAWRALALLLLVIVTACSTDDGDGAPPAEAEPSLPEAGVPSDPSTFAITVQPSTLALTAGATESVTVSVTRSAGVAQSLRLEVVGLPDGLTASPLEIGADTASGTLNVASATSALQGRHTATVRATDAAGRVASSALVLQVRGRPGALDTTWEGGSRTLSFGSSTFDQAFASAIQPDGKLVVGGFSFTGSHAYPYLARYLANGNLDPSFGAGGLVVEEGLGIEDLNPSAVSVVAIALQPDGKELALLSSMKVLRYDAGGKRDLTFGSGGLASIDFGTPRAEGVDLARQPDGRIVVTGIAHMFPAAIKSSFGVVRLDANGAYDPSFGANGRALTAFSAADAYPTSVSVDVTSGATNDIVVAGFTTDGEIAVARYLGTNGALDPAFDGDGKLLFRPGPATFNAASEVLVSDGKLTLLANTSNGSGLVRILRDGTRDATFGQNGVATMPTGGLVWASGMAPRPGGGFVVAGGTGAPGDDADLAAVFLLDDGSADTSVSPYGMVTASFGAKFEDSKSVVAQNDGRIVLVGGATIGTDRDLALVRFGADGVLDPTFGGAGKVRTNVGRGDDLISSAILLDDGRVLATGATFNGSLFEFLTLRLTPSLDLDPTFGKAGVVRSRDINRDDYSARGNGIAVQPDGKIVIGGAIELSHAVVRLSSEGAPDTTFGKGGTAHSGNGTGAGRSFALQSDGKLVVAGGSYDQNFGIARFTTTGKPDAFGLVGVVETSFGGRAQANAVAIQKDQKLVVVGERYLPDVGASRDWAAARYLPDGSLDASFDGDGKLLLDLGGDDVASAIALQSDGKLLFAGRRQAGDVASFVVARYSSAGVPDATFGVAGRVTSPVGTRGDVHRLSVQADGSIVLLGCAVSAQREGTVLSRLRPDGSPDAAFGTAGTSFSAAPLGARCGRAMLRLPDGKLLVLGSARSGFDEDVLLERYWN